MTTPSRQLMRKAVRLYSCEYATLAINKHNRRQWLRSVRLLGDKWLLANPIGRVQ